MLKLVVMTFLKVLSKFVDSNTSGSKIVDQFIRKNNLNWIPYNNLKNIEYLNKGGFGTIYKAIHRIEGEDFEVILRHFDYLDNSDESLKEFLNELKIIKYAEIIKIYGFTKNPNTLNYMLMMKYTSEGLNKIHEEGLIHYNFHDGNILCHKYEEENTYGVFISDYIGLHYLTKSFLKENDIYGIIPFMAPEILRGQPYTQASDIYNFSMVMWEFISGIPPFNDKAHDFQLALSICKGERPEIIENTPQCYIDLMKKCWDEDPLKRPSTKEILDIFNAWVLLPFRAKAKEINEELKSNIMEFINAPIEHNNHIVKSHPQACYTSHLLDFTSKELNEILESQELKSFEMNQKDDTKQKLLKLERIAETYYQSSQNELKEKQLAYQNIQIELANLQQLFEQENQNLINITEKQVLANNLKQISQEKTNLQDKLVQSETQELKFQQFKNQLSQSQINYKQIEERNLKLENELVNLQQRNFQFEQDNQNLRLDLALQLKKSAEKENTLQLQITYLQNEKQALDGDLTEQLDQNKLVNHQVQNQIDQLMQEKIGLKERLTQTEVNFQELEFKLSHSQANYKKVKQEKIQLCNRLDDLSQDQKLTVKLKAKSEKEKAEMEKEKADVKKEKIELEKGKAELEKEKAEMKKEFAQLKQKLNIEEQIKMQLTQALQIKEDKINELEQRLIDLDYERIKKLKVKENELISGKNIKEIHKEREAKQKEIDELQQELLTTSASYDTNRKKQVLNQVNNFLKAKGKFLTLWEEAIEKLQDCFNQLESSINKVRNTIGSTRKISTLTDKYTKEFQSILTKYSDEVLQLNKDDYYSLKYIVQKNKELEFSLMIENILKLNDFNFDNYKIFKFATNSQEGTMMQLNSNMMAEDINSLRKNLDELKLELKQEEKELRNLEA
ncbi:unnamed protein product [Rhizophagus irregularis]|nr:unnamed protein product [Rhizophagus irregularis]